MPVTIKYRRIIDVTVTVDSEPMTAQEASTWANFWNLSAASREDAGDAWLEAITNNNPRTIIKKSQWEPLEANPPFVEPQSRRRRTKNVKA